MTRLLIAAFLVASALSAQTTPAVPYVVPYPTIYTPEIQLGSTTQPSVITVPPVVEVASGEHFATSPEPPVSNAPPASTELLATRHFDFITSPVDQATPGSMEDTSISLGEYARKLRAQKQAAAISRATPNAMSQPTK
jgi:hypothetical protein